MLSKHPEACRHPHGHSRRIELVVAAHELDANDMVVDFKALKLLAEPLVNRFDHTMSLNAADPLRSSIESVYPGSTVPFEGEDPTTEAMARRLFIEIANRLDEGFADGPYRIAAGRCRLERVRVWETETSWAEYALD